MATTYEIIASVTVGSGGAADIDFTSIPQTYTDLNLVISSRDNNSQLYSYTSMQLNGSGATVYSYRNVQADGSSASSQSGTGNIAAFYIDTVGNTATANTFGNMSIYFPNYTSSNFKSFSVDAVTENNGTAAFIDMGAHLFSDTNAINRITFISAGLFLEHSTAYLYGISNA
jgi:hypothetical protein